MKKYTITYSWYYEDFRSHGGCMDYTMECDHIPSKDEVFDYLEKEDVLPCSRDCVKIESIEAMNG